VCGALSLDELVRFGVSSKTIYLPEGRVLVRDVDKTVELLDRDGLQRVAEGF
jgi:hypothetical protein